jgi:hypothetical protein
LRVARARPHDEVGEVATQNVVAGVAAVVAQLDVYVVAPGFAEPVAGEVGHPIPPLDGKPCQQRPRVVVVGRACRWRGRRLLRPVTPVQPQHNGDGHRKQTDQSGNDAAHIAVLALKPVEC